MIAAQQYAVVKVDQVHPHPDNPRRGDVGAIAASIERNGFYGALIVQRSTGHILAGSHRWAAARSGGAAELPALLVDCDDDTARRILVADNRTSDLATWDDAALADLLRGMAATPDGLAGTAYTDGELMRLVADLARVDSVPLSDQFLLAPFSVLDGRKGWWQQRRRQWLALGIRSEAGRLDGAAAGEKSVFGTSSRRQAQTHGTRRLQKEVLGRKLDGPEMTGGEPARGTSVFDPVLCELAYRWWSPQGGVVLDPFAGGSVRGVTAAVLGRHYRGNDLSARQVAANVEQAAAILPAAGAGGSARWDTGDSAAWEVEPDSADMLFTCPPYYDTERYGGGPGDLSGMSVADFDAAYAVVLARCAAALRRDRFAVLVVGDSRSSRTRLLRDLRGATVRAAAAAGLGYCTAGVHVMPAWSAAVSAAPQFKASRSLGRHHEDVLVFVKGTASGAAKACGQVDVSWPTEDSPI